MPTVFYHNPRCSKSRAVAALLGDFAIDVETIEYLKSGFTEAQLRQLIAALDQPAAALIRASDESFKSSQIDAQSISEQEVIDFLIAHPQAFQRPVVVRDGKARIGRPPESIKDILA